MHCKINDPRLSHPLAVITVLIAALFFCTPSASAQENNDTDGKELKITGFASFGAQTMKFNNASGQYDDLDVKTSEFKITDSGLVNQPSYSSKAINGKGTLTLHRKDSSDKSDRPISVGGLVNNPKIHSYYYGLNVRPGDFGNKVTIKSLGATFTVDGKPLGLTSPTVTQPSVTITLEGKSVNPPPPPPPPPPGTQNKGRVHLHNKIDIFAGSNKPSTASTRISLRAGRTGGGGGQNGGSGGGSGAAGGGSGAAGGGNGGGGGQKGGAGGGSGAAGGGSGAAGGGNGGAGGQKGGAGGGNGGGGGQKGGSGGGNGGGGGGNSGGGGQKGGS